MEWIQEHITEILGIIIGLYGVARAIVALTPTPKDNVALEEHVGKPLRILAKAFGLDLTQGRHKNGD